MFVVNAHSDATIKTAHSIHDILSYRFISPKKMSAKGITTLRRAANFVSVDSRHSGGASLGSVYSNSNALRRSAMKFTKPLTTRTVGQVTVNRPLQRNDITPSITIPTTIVERSVSHFLNSCADSSIDEIMFPNTGWACPLSNSSLAVTFCAAFSSQIEVAFRCGISVE